VPIHDLDELVRRRAVEGRVGLADDDRRVDRLRLEHLHAGLDAEVARLSRRGDDRGRVDVVGSDRDRPSAKRPIVLLLDRGERAVQVDDERRRLGQVEAKLDGLPRRGPRTHKQMFS